MAYNQDRRCLRQKPQEAYLSERGALGGAGLLSDGVLEAFRAVSVTGEDDSAEDVVVGSHVNWCRVPNAFSLVRRCKLEDSRGDRGAEGSSRWRAIFVLARNSAMAWSGWVRHGGHAPAWSTRAGDALLLTLEWNGLMKGVIVNVFGMMSVPPARSIAAEMANNVPSTISAKTLIWRTFTSSS